jgi:predicted dehydrogenase
MRFLIAGFGSIGRRHFRNLLALGEKEIIFFRTHKSTLDDDELSDFIVETDLAKALAQDPEGVIVSNPTACHLDVAIPAAQAGCDILLEKPVSHSMERVEDFRKIVEAKGSDVLIGFQFRFHPGLQRIKELLAAEQIGRPLSVRAHWGEYLPGWHPWEDYRKGYSARADLGGGVILTLSHPFDYLRWLLGDVRAVWAFAASNSGLDVDVEDTAEIGLRFENDCLGSVHLNYTQRPPSHWLEIVGTKGTIHWSYNEGDLKVYHPGDDQWRDYPVKSGFSRNELFLDEMRHFIDIVSDKADPICPLMDGIRVQELIAGVKASAKTGRIVHFA